MGLGRRAMLKPVDRRGRPGIIAFKADLARPDWRGGGGGATATGSLPVFTQSQNCFFGLQQVELVEPVAGDLEDFESVIAEDHRQRRLLVAGHRHVVLELGHVALEDVFAAGEGIGVLGFPDGATVFDQAVERASPPVVPLAGEIGANAGHGLTGDPLEPLPVERLGPAAEHRRKLGGEIDWATLAAFLQPQLEDAV